MFLRALCGFVAAAVLLLPGKSEAFELELIEDVLESPTEAVPRADLAFLTKSEGGLTPCVLSAIIPGLGQWFNGELVKGILFLVVVGGLYGGYFFSPFDVFGGLGGLLHLLAVVDAYLGGSLVPLGSGGDGPRPPAESARPVER